MIKNPLPYIRLEGDKELAEGWLRRARAEMDRTVAVMERMGVADYQRYTRLDENSYVITKATKTGLRVINIYAAPHAPGKLEEKKEVKEEFESKKPLSIYSGFVYEGWMPEVLDGEGNPTYPYLTQFNPTSWCRKTNPGDFDPDLDYQNVPRLRIERSDELFSVSKDLYYWEIKDHPPNAIVSQYSKVRACAYTGLMAKAVSAVLGYGNFNFQDDSEYDDILNDYRDLGYVTAVKANGFQILWDCRFTRCHSITRASTGKLWIVECSANNGIIATPLKYLNPDLFSFNPEEDWPVATIKDELGGLPSGESFPASRNDVLVGLANGTIIELMSPEEYGEFITDDWLEYSETNCWAFNDDGTEGRVTCFRFYKDDVNYRETGYFKLTINIGEAGGDANITPVTPHQVMVQGNRLQKVTPYTVPPELEVSNTFGRGAVNDTLFTFYQPDSNTWQSLSVTTTKEKWEEIRDELPDIMENVIWVGYINGNWEELSVVLFKDSDLEDTYFEWQTPSLSFYGVSWEVMEEWNLGPLMPLGYKDALGKKEVYWNHNGLPIIKWAHVKIPSRNIPRSYKIENFIKDYKGLRWKRVDSVQQVGSGYGQEFPSPWTDVGNMAMDFSIQAVPSTLPNGQPGQTIQPGAFITGIIRQSFAAEITYSGFWTYDFPEIKSRILIPPFNRSAYQYYEHEYFPRNNGPWMAITGNGGDWYLNYWPSGGVGFNPAGYYTNNRTVLGFGTIKFNVLVAGDKGHCVRDETPFGESQSRDLVDTQWSVPNLINQHHVSLYGSTILPYPYMGHDYFNEQGGRSITVVDTVYNEHVSDQSPGPPALMMQWANNRLYYNHPDDYILGDYGVYGDWHSRVDHTTYEDGVTLITDWKVQTIITEGYPNVARWYSNISYFSSAIDFFWSDLQTDYSSSFLSDLGLYPFSIPKVSTLPMVATRTTIDGPSNGYDVAAAGRHQPVEIQNRYNEWKPYIKYYTFIVCDKHGVVQNLEEFVESDKVTEFKYDNPSGVSTFYHQDTNGDEEIQFPEPHLTAQDLFVQHAVIGKDAIVHSELTTVNHRGEGYREIVAKGEHPVLPDTDGDDQFLKQLTFIGVNSV